MASLKNRVFYGWWIIVLGSIIQAVGGGILYHSFTVFFLPLKRDLGVSSAAISLLYGAARLEGGAEGPIVGHFIDRLGSRALIIFGACLAGIGLILLATVNNYWTFFFIYIFVVSLGFNAGFYHPVSAAVTTWFIRHRGVGFSIISAAGGIGGMIMAPLLSFIILNYGWRTGSVVAGLMILGVAVPAALPWRRSPEVLGLYPDGRPPPENHVEEARSARGEVAEPNYTVKEALRTVWFWLLMTAITLRILVTVALNTHLIPILVWKGMDEATSAYSVSVFALGTIISSLVTGWIGDRWSKALLCSICIGPTIVAMLGLMLSQEIGFLYFFPIGFAITHGIVPLNWALVGDFFGRRIYATLRGIIGIGTGIATFFSPIYAGWIFDLTGSYTLVLLTFSIILTISATFFAMLQRPSPPRFLPTYFQGK